MATGLLGQVSTGKIRQPFLGLLYGTDGVGKSTFGAAMPSPLFLGAESGTANLDVHRISVTSLRDAFTIIKELSEASHDYQTLVIDSLDWLEPLVWEHVITGANDKKISSIEDFGYGKGYALAVDEWRKLISALRCIREKRGMNILLVGHAQVKDAKDPTVINDYNRYQLKLNDKAAALLREWVDCVFFANFETVTAEKKGKIKAFGDGARYIYTERRPAFDAKNRFGLPYQMALEWEGVRDALESSNPEDPAVIAHTIETMIEEVKGDNLKEQIRKALDSCRTDLLKLKRLENKVMTIVNTPSA